MDINFDPDRALAITKMYRYTPYGHPDMECPNGRIWKINRDRLGWLAWSNKPWQLDFHNAGKNHMERGVFSANANGKTLMCAAEVAYHLTGWYPDWWDGRRFNKPILAWVCSRSNDAQREYTQPALVGDNLGHAYGTGAIPLKLMIGKPRVKAAGLPDVVDTVLVQRHDGKGTSTLRFKSYEQGWEAQTGGKPDVIWDDEEFDDYRIYTEQLTRLARTNGIVLVSMTPMKGETKLTQHFMRDNVPGTWWIGATWDDVAHLTEETRNHLRGAYPEHELQARTTGVPMMGGGRIFAVPESSVFIDPIEIPYYYAKIKGLDFGIAHPAAAVQLAINRDSDVVFVTWDWRRKVEDYTEHVEALRSIDPWVPIAWPHDGENRDKSGLPTKRLYQKHGLPMLGKSACYKSDKLGPQPVWPIIQDTQERLASGRMFVFNTCRHFKDEYNSFHTNDKGDPVAIHDDVLKAFFYALMMKRYAATRGVSAEVGMPPARPMLRVV